VWPAPLAATLFLGSATMAPATARDQRGPGAASDSGLVMQLCLAGFASAMEEAGKSAPSGMADYTCGCFLRQLEGGQSVLGAQNHCRSLASRRYRL
jgi:hypothetical protein